MEETAKRIRHCLKCSGFSNRKVSVKCFSSYQIKITTKNLPDYEVDAITETVENIYYAKRHGWLIIWVNNHCLPMSKKEYACTCTAERKVMLCCGKRDTSLTIDCKFNKLIK